AVLTSCDRSMIFGGTPTVERYHGNPRVQAHGPGFSKIVIGDDLVDKAIDTIEQSAKTGNVGDGKIFVSEIAQAVRIRTGETGQDAL
ncbi:aldehyde dehydrogenase, partial [bacterium]|nr:aldehyde dehydrogenase [bacterium]